MRDLLEKLEKEMRQAFESSRARFEHSGNKGANCEAIVREFLAHHLPRCYGVGHGEVVDSRECRSAQTDIVIVSDEHPFTYTPTEPGLFFIEGVYAVGEVKAVLTSQELDRTIANALKLRSLKLSPVGMTMYFDVLNESDYKRFGASPPYFLFAFETQLSSDAILKKLAAQNSRSVDAVFTLDGKAIIDMGDGQGWFGIWQSGKPGSPPLRHIGWFSFPPVPPLALLLSWLSGMPSPRYGKAILTKYVTQAVNFYVSRGEFSEQRAS